MSERRCTAFIFARGGSKGVPRKNVRELGGKPLIAHSIETALACPSISRVVVSTDDEEIAAVARAAGAETPWMRPAELARDDSPEWLAWRHAINAERDAGHPMDVFVCLPPTSPLRAVEDVEAAIAALQGEVDLVISSTPAARSPHLNMVTLDEEGFARLMITPDKKIVRRQDAPPAYDVTTVVYAARPQYILESDEFFGGNVKSVVIPPERALDIDTPLDFRIAEIMFADRKSA